jgi:YD repeat-containing protein
MGRRSAGSGSLRLVLVLAVAGALGGVVSGSAAAQEPVHQPLASAVERAGPDGAIDFSGMVDLERGVCVGMFDTASDARLRSVQVVGGTPLVERLSRLLRGAAFGEWECEDLYCEETGGHHSFTGYQFLERDGAPILVGVFEGAGLLREDENHAQRDVMQIWWRCIEDLGLTSMPPPAPRPPCHTEVYEDDELVSRRVYEHFPYERMAVSVTYTPDTPSSWTQAVHYYDQGNRELQRIETHHEHTDGGHNSLEVLTTFRYSPEGRLVELLISGGIDTGEEYHYTEGADGRVQTRQRVYFSEADYHTHTITTEYAYDDQGRVVGETVTRVRQSDEEGAEPQPYGPQLTRQLAYNADGDVVTVTETEADTGLVRRTVHSYDCWEDLED